jgi:hypothetical protein
MTHFFFLAGLSVARVAGAAKQGGVGQVGGDCELKLSKALEPQVADGC